MRQVTILSGRITAKGNLTGYNAIGERIHVSAQQLTSAGIDPLKLTFPIFAITVERTFDKRDADDKPIIDPTTNKPETFVREQAGSIFTTEQAMSTAMNADKLIAIRTNAEVQLASLNSVIELNKVATASGLSTESVASLMESSLFN